MSTRTYTGPVGSTLWVRVWEYGNNAFGAFNICATMPPPPATNDNPCQFITLTPNTSCITTAATNIGATPTTVPAIPAPGCASYAGGDVWFQVTVPASGTVTVTTSTVGGSPVTDSGLAFYTSPACAVGPFTLVSCNDDIGFPNLMSTLSYTGAAGTVLWVRVWEYGNNALGPFNICATAPGPPPPAPTNNDPCGAFNLTVTSNCAYSNYTNVGATNSATTPPPGCGNFGAGSLDVWFSFVAPPTGIVTVQTQAGTMTDLAMALYADPPPPGCAGPFTLVQCDDDSGPGLMPFLSFTNLTPGWTYYLRTWGYGTATGTFNLCVFGPTTVPAGACVYALELYDTFGDGWGSSAVQVSINGVITNYTVVGAYNVVLLGVNPGDLVIITYIGTGPGQAENRFELSFLSSGATIYNSGTPPPPGINFTQSVTCTPPPTPPQDCAGGITVCSGQSFSNNTNNTGNVVDLTAANQGCLASGERQGTWYYFSPSASGTIGFTIAPAAPTDYDFAVWGPMASIVCPPSGPPLRCSYAAPFGNTGAGNGATDPSEGAGGDRWVSTFNVLAGQIYIMYIDNFSTNGQAFNLTWQLSNGASLDCTLLPIELVAFTATMTDVGVDLRWTSASEVNSARFEIERSADGERFTGIGVLPSAGNTAQQHDYSFLDRTPAYGTNHYRLRLVDLDDRAMYSSVESVLYHRLGNTVQLVPNPGSGLVDVLLPAVEPGSTLMMIDATGREVLRVALDGERVTIDATVLPHGLYGFRVLSPSGQPLAHGTWVRE